MATQSTANNADQLQTFYDNAFLETFNESLVLDKWADKKTIPLYRGKTVDFFRYYAITPDSTAISEGSSTANEVTVSGQTLQATVAKYAQWAPWTEMIQLVARDPKLQQQAALWGQAAASSLDLALAKELFQKGSIPIRVDELKNDATYSYEGTVDSSTSHTLTTTVLLDTGLTDANDNFNGGHFAVIAGATRNYGHGSMVTDFSATHDLLTLTTAAPLAYTTGTKYRVVVGTGLAAANKMTGTAIEYAVAKAREQKFYTFGGWYRSSLASQVEYDLMQNAVWRAIGEYQSKGDLEQWIIRRLWGVEFARTTNPYRESVAGVYSATGVVFCTPIMGAHALGNVSLSGMREHKFLMKTPGPQSTDQPIDECGSTGYKFYAAPKALNAAFCINLLSGATGVA